MAVNKDSNSYTFIFAILMVIIVGSGLAAVSVGLKPMQDKNTVTKKKMDILNALQVTDLDDIDEVNRKNANDLYNKFVIEEECIVLNSFGIPIEGEVAFDIDIKTEFKNKNLVINDRKYPLYIAEIGGEKKYIIPMVGSGLWGPIWGYIAVNGDKSSIFGASFDHKTETPGLGAEIKQGFFTDRFKSEVISENGTYKKLKFVKDGSGTDLHKIDGITGGTITSKGVEEMLDRTIQVYVDYFNNN